MSKFDHEKATVRVPNLLKRAAYPHVPKPNEGFSREETSSIYVDSEAIVEERSARPPAPPRASARSLKPGRELQETPVVVPKAGILKVPKSLKRE